MANRYANLVGSNKIKDEWQKINTGFDLVQQDVDQLQADLAQEIADREAAVEYVDQRVDNIIVGGGPDKDPELVDIRTVDPSYTPQRTINAAGDVTRDMQAQFVAHKAETVSHWVNAEHYDAVGDGTTDDSSALQEAVDVAVSKGYGTVYIPFEQMRLGSNVDCKGLHVVGNNTVLTGNGNLQHTNGMTDLVLNGFDYMDTQVDPAIIAGLGTEKVIYRTSNSEYNVITKKASGNGYLNYILRTDVTSSANSTNHGPPGELLRVTGLQNVLKAWVYKRAYSNRQGTWEENTYIYPVGNAGRSLVAWRNTSQSASDYIEFTVNVPDDGKFTIGLLAATNASNAVKISVDGEEVETLNLNMPARLVIREFKSMPGERTVRVTSGQDSRYVYVFGVNFYELDQARNGLEYDYFGYRRDDNAYITSTGSIDYAMMDDDTGKWVGSYHGGETLISRRICVDGNEVDIEVGSTYVGRNLRLEQVTNIVDKLTSYTTLKFAGDGILELQCQLIGEITTRTFYTAMTTTNPNFVEIRYPINHTISSSSDGDVFLGRKNRVVQRNPATNQQVSTLFSLFSKDNNMVGGVFVRPDTSYNKVYYARVARSLETIRNISFQTVWIFE